VQLKGERQTLDVLSKDVDQAATNFEADFINYRYFNDKTFCEYQDWKERIERRFNLAEFSVEQVSNMSKILLNKFCQGVTNKLTYLPITKHTERMKRLNIEFKLFKEEASEAV
jgi:hypothetical protein